MRVEFTVRGLGRWKRRIDAAPKKMTDNQKWVLREVGRLAVRYVRAEVKGRRSWAKRRGRPVTARPGRLGNVTHKGRKSIQATKPFHTPPNMWSIQIFSPRDYMNIHEARGKYRWLRPGIRRVNPRLKRTFGRVFKGI